MKLIETVNDFIGLFIIAIIIVCVAMFIQNGYNNLTYMRSINKLIFTNFCL